MSKSVDKYFSATVNCFKISCLFIVGMVLLLVWFWPMNSEAQSKPRQYLLALSKAEHTLTIVDAATFKVIAKVPVGPDPHEVVASSDGKTAYVSSYGGGRFHELDVIDIINQKLLTKVDTDPLKGLHGLMFANGKVWFTAEGSGSVGSYDPHTGKVDWSMTTGQDRTHMIYVTADGKKVYTTNVNSGTVSILTDTFPGKWVAKVVHVSKGAEGFDVSPNGGELWTAAATDGAISIIDLGSNKVSEKIDAKIFGANRLKFTPDGRRILVSSLSNGDLFIYDAQSRKELKRVNIGSGAAGILIEPNGSRAFIGCTADNYVAVVDLKTFQVINHIDVGNGPDGLAWAAQK
ncbi:YncE family protein [Mucilaginibacter aquaedulcis]|uniref:YncE family protein n=1 Tax=Mucilaginibacter aquaedulcis TaxID=1187081 RepID=UPI0025B49147|nr:YncE family protein [Mucilaginibacter aquaedulcis]MDN3548606.1 YncE family protein [Mucilaginibacter aquaedulcis]